MKGLIKGTLVVTVLVVAALSYQGQSKGDKNKSIREELMQLQRAEDEAEDRRDIVTLDRLLSDDFILIAPNGVISDKKKLIEDVKNGEAG